MEETIFNLETLSNLRYPIKRLVIEKGVKENPVSKWICERLPHLIPEYLEEGSIVSLRGEVSTLIICRHKGKFLKPCPGTKEYLCCKYNFLNIGLNCPIQCTYCILQAYLNTPSLIVYVNYDDLFQGLAEELKNDPSLIRIGTGELTDSLALDPLTRLSIDLIKFFSQQRQAYLELKTKSDHVDHLLDLDHQGQTIISWSMNPQRIIDQEEGYAAPLEKRLEAAKKCQERGYKIGLHFDPILFYKGWEGDYKTVIDQIFSVLDPKGITWISLGCFRFIPPLKAIIQKRFPESMIIYEEFIPGLDKKQRYPQPLRIEVYTKMYKWIKDKAPQVFVYMCMESSEVWRAALGYVPESNEVLKVWLDERCRI